MMTRPSHRICLRGIVGVLGLLGAVVVVCGLLAPVPSVRAQGGEAWGERAPMLLPRSEASVAELNGKIYFIGGYPGTRLTSDSVQVYDPQADSWELGPPLPIPLHHTMAAVVDGRLYVIGGEAGNPTGNESIYQRGVLVLDEQLGAWIPRAPMPTAR